MKIFLRIHYGSEIIDKKVDGFTFHCNTNILVLITDNNVDGYHEEYITLGNKDMFYIDR